jgi:hypothetical protein
MPAVNLYATLADFQGYMTPRGGSISTDATDDATATILLESVSRYIDSETDRHFFPVQKTHLYDIPDFHTDTLWLDDDLLGVVTLTNGDSTVISSSDYILRTANTSPYWAIKLRMTSNITWEPDADGSDEQVISVAGVWGWHNDYAAHGWAIGGTLGAAISDTTGLSFTMTAGHSLVAGQLIKIGSELFNISTVGATALAVIARGDNGSTAATHSNGATVYIWQVVPIVKSAVLAIAQSVYQSRSGQASGGKISVTAAGVVIRPEDVPPMAAKVIDNLRRVS